MAIGALVGQGTLVVVVVAADAGFLQAEVSLCSLFQFGVFHKIRAMALPAISSFVCSSERVAGQLMIKLLLVKTHHVKIDAMVIAVALDTFFAHNGFGSVIARFFVHPAFDF